MVEGANQVSAAPQHQSSSIGPDPPRLGGDDWPQDSARMLRVLPGRGNLVRVSLFVALVTWVPLLLLTAIEGTLLSGPTIPAIQSLGTHTRLLVSIPLFLLAESQFSRRAAEIGRAMQQPQLVASRDLPQLLRAWRQ